MSLPSDTEKTKVVRSVRHKIEVWVKGDDRPSFEFDSNRYHLRRSLRAYLDWVFKTTPEPKPAKLLSANFSGSVMREVMCLLYSPEDSA